jgi:hypothetical protein
MVAVNPSPQDSLNQVRQALEGGTIAVIGGDRRHAHLHRLSEAFALQKLLWVPTRESDASARRFVSVVGHAEMIMVISLHGLLRHQHTRDLRNLCRKLNIPHLTYWRSPHPLGVAAAIVAQQLVNAILDRRGRLVSPKSVGR